MRILFMGSPEEVVSCLEALVSHCQNHASDEFIGVVSQPARPAGRKGVLTDPPVAAYAKARELPVWQPEKARDPEFLKELEQLAPDVIITAAYGQILSDAFLAIPKRATINIHPSLLPRYRGATPVQAALLNGDQETGVCILFTVKALDAGAIIACKHMEIDPEETTASLLPRSFKAGAELIAESLDKLRDDTYQGDPQDDSQMTTCKKILKQDGFLKASDSAKLIYNRHRAFHPWPGTFTFFHDRRVVITEMALASSDAQQGKEVGMAHYDKSQGGIVVSAAGGSVVLRKLKPAGGKEMDAAAFWNGLKSNEPVLLPVSLEA